MRGGRDDVCDSVINLPNLLLASLWVQHSNLGTTINLEGLVLANLDHSLDDILQPEYPEHIFGPLLPPVIRPVF